MAGAVATSADSAIEALLGGKAVLKKLGFLRGLTATEPTFQPIHRSFDPLTIWCDYSTTTRKCLSAETSAIVDAILLAYYAACTRPRRHGRRGRAGARGQAGHRRPGLRQRAGRSNGPGTERMSACFKPVAPRRRLRHPRPTQRRCQAIHGPDRRSVLFPEKRATAAR